MTGGDGCVTERNVRAAMARYADRVAPDVTLSARVHVATPGLSFELVRGDAVLAERTFASVPQRCRERVRALAIALVLAFESVQQGVRANAGAAPPAATGKPSDATAPAVGGSTAVAQPAGDAARATPAEAPADVVRNDAPAAEQAQQPEDAEPAEEAKPATEDEAREEVAEQDEAEQAADDEAPIAPSEASLVLHAGGGILLGVLPEPAVLLTLGAGVPLGASLQLELSALASPGVSHPLADGVVDAQLFGGQGALCLGVPLGALRASGCAGLAAAAVPAQGSDFAVKDASTVTGWAAAALGAALELRLAGPISTRVFANLYGSLVRPSLEVKVDGARRDATPLPIGAAFLMQLLWALP